MISAQRCQIFDRQIVIDPDYVPRMDHSSVSETDAAVSPIDRAVFAWAQAIIEYERSPSRSSALQRVLVQLTGFLCGISTKYFDMVADLKRILNKRKTPACILCAAGSALCEILDDIGFTFSFLVKDESIPSFYDTIA